MNPDTPSTWRRDELAYCSNVHPGEHLDEVRDVVARFVGPVRDARQLRRMGAGLWLSSAAAAALAAEPSQCERLRDWLAQHGIDLFTLNGFPYAGFHRDTLKSQVYVPDWSSPERLEYTLNAARVLARMLPPEQAEGTVSTLPLGFRPGWDEARHRQALQTVCALVPRLAELEDAHGRRIRVCFEMEPGCVLERTEDVLRLFGEELPAAASRAGLSRQWLSAYLGVCFDVCHQAVMFEDGYTCLQQLHAAGISIGKIQISSALEARQPSRPRVRDALADFDEPRYLHQVGVLERDGAVRCVMDLPDALNAAELHDASAWRVHFHVPIVIAALDEESLDTTQSQILGVLDYLADHRELHPHLEVETYTWEVLPEALRPATSAELVQGLANELGWLEARMAERGLLETEA